MLLASVLTYWGENAALPQVTAMLVTLAEPTVPVPLVTLQAWPAGSVDTVTLYGIPVLNGVVNAKAPLALTLKLLAPLFSRTTVPLNPETLPPMENPPHVTATLRTSVHPAVPDPLTTAQF